MAKIKTISVKIDAEAYKKAVQVLKERGTDLDTWIQLQVFAFGQANVGLLKLEDKMPGGKYSGAKIEDVVRADLTYAAWMMSQDWATKYGQDVQELVRELTELKKENKKKEKLA